MEIMNLTGESESTCKGVNPPEVYLEFLHVCTLCLHACQVRVTVGNLGLCCCTCYVFQVLIN